MYKIEHYHFRVCVLSSVQWFSSGRSLHRACTFTFRLVLVLFIVLLLLQVGSFCYIF